MHSCDIVSATPTALELTSRAQSLLYSEDVPNDVRFSGVNGQERLDMCFAMYEKTWQDVLRALQLPPDLNSIPWHHPHDGRRLIVRHPLNQRQNESHLQNLVESIRERNVCYGLRGECWNQISVDCSLLWTLAWGTLTDAIYVALERYPHEETIVKLKNDGLKKCRVFDSKLPTSVALWMKAFHNEFGASHQVSALDWLDEWPSLMKQFALKCKENGWHSKMDGYQQKMLDTYRLNASSLLGKSIGGWSHVNEINSIVNFAKANTGSIELLRGFCRERVVIVQEIMIVNTDVLKIMYSVKGLVEKHVKDNALRGLFWVAFTALAFPTDIDLKLLDKEVCAKEELSKEDSTWVLRRATAENIKTVAELLEFKMAGSKTFQIMSALDDDDPRTPAPEGLKDPDDDCEAEAQPLPKRRRGAAVAKPKGKAKAAAKASQKQKDDAKKTASMRKLISALEIPLADLTWPDDVAALVRVCCQSAGFGSMDEFAAQQVGFPVVVESVKFAMLGKLKPGSAKSMISKWSDFRRHILDQMKGIDIPTDACSIASMLLRSCSRGDDDQHDELGAASSLDAFLTTTDVRIPVRLQHAAMCTMQRVYVDDDFICELKATSRDGGVGACLALILGAVDNTLKPQWFPLATRLALTLMSGGPDKSLDNPNVQSLLSKCGEDTQAKLTTLELIGKMRARYTMLMLNEATRTVSCLAGIMPGTEHLSKLESANHKAIDALLQLDAAAVDRHELWKRLAVAKSEADIIKTIEESNLAGVTEGEAPTSPLNPAIPVATPGATVAPSRLPASSLFAADVILPANWKIRFPVLWFDVVLVGLQKIVTEATLAFFDSLEDDSAVLIDVTGPKPTMHAHKKVLTADFKIPMSGQVSLVPSKESVELVEVLGVKIFLAQSKSGDVLGVNIYDTIKGSKPSRQSTSTVFMADDILAVTCKLFPNGSVTKNMEAEPDEKDEPESEKKDKKGQKPKKRVVTKHISSDTPPAAVDVELQLPCLVVPCDDKVFATGAGTSVFHLVSTTKPQTVGADAKVALKSSKTIIEDVRKQHAASKPDAGRGGQFKHISL